MQYTRTEILDQHQESGTVFKLVDKAMYYILNNIRRRFVMDGLGPREEIPEIPTLAVREALMNAYAHQDWTLGGCVQIDIFNDAFADFKSAKTGEKRREAASTEKLLAQMGRNDAEVYEFIKEKGKVSRSLISAEFKMPDRTVLNCLKRLIEANLVISIGSGRKTEYTTVEQR